MAKAILLDCADKVPTTVTVPTTRDHAGQRQVADGQVSEQKTQIAAGLSRPAASVFAAMRESLEVAGSRYRLMQVIEPPAGSDANSGHSPAGVSALFRHAGPNWDVSRLVAIVFGGAQWPKSLDFRRTKSIAWL